MPCESLKNKNANSPLGTKDFIKSFENIGFVKVKRQNLYELDDTAYPISIRERDLRVMFNAIVNKTHIGQKNIPKEILSILNRICITVQELCKVFLNKLTKQEYLKIIKDNTF